MTNAELTILGLIAEQSRHGYDIEHVIEARGMRAWTDIGFSSIYYLLNKLEKNGLITSRQQQPEGRGPARKVYSITEQGLAAYIEAALAALSTPQDGSSPFLLGLSSLPALPRDQALSALKTYASRKGERLARMLESAETQRPLPPVAETLFDYSRMMAQAELNWIKGFIQQLEAEYG